MDGRATETKRKKGETHIQSQGLTAISPLVAINPNQGLATLEQAGLQTDDDKLHARAGMFANIIGDFGDIGVVERGVDFVEHEEGRRLVAVHGEEEGERGHGFLTPGQVLHVPEAFEGRHGVVFDAVQIGLVAVFHVEITKINKENWLGDCVQNEG